MRERILVALLVAAALTCLVIATTADGATVAKTDSDYRLEAHAHALVDLIVCREEPVRCPAQPEPAPRLAATRPPFPSRAEILRGFPRRNSVGRCYQHVQIRRAVGRPGHAERCERRRTIRGGVRPRR